MRELCEQLAQAVAREAGLVWAQTPGHARENLIERVRSQYEVGATGDETALGEAVRRVIAEYRKTGQVPASPTVEIETPKGKTKK